MKKSTIIITAFAAFIVLSTLIFYIDAKSHEGKENEWKKANQKEFKINDFKVLVAEEGADVHFVSRDTSKIIAETENDSVFPNKLYAQSNDTLYVYKGARLYAHGKSLKSVISRNAKWIGIHPYIADTLKLDIQGGELQLNVYEDNKLSKYNYIQISATKKADIRMGGNISAQKILLNATESSINFYDGNFNNMDAKLSTKSELKIGRILNTITNLRADKDSTSQVSY